MNKHEITGGEKASVENLLMKSGVPGDYEPFARQIANLPSSEREERMKQMMEDRDFEPFAENLRSFFSSYDSEILHRADKASVETEAEPAAPIKTEAEKNFSRTSARESPRSSGRHGKLGGGSDACGNASRGN